MTSVYKIGNTLQSKLCLYVVIRDVTCVTFVRCYQGRYVCYITNFVKVSPVVLFYNQQQIILSYTGILET